VYNDLDQDIVNLFECLRDDELRQRLTEQLVLTPYSRAEFERAWLSADNQIERARRTVIRAQMGFGSAGATKGITGFRIDSKRQYGTAQHLWTRFPDQLAAIGQRLAGVLIENRPAIEVMAAHDAPSTLHYVDPPYMHATRVRGSAKGRYYRHELDDAQHLELLATLNNLQGMVIISGYPNQMYDTALPGWARNRTNARISAGRGGATRQECLWINPAGMHALQQSGLQLGATA